MILRCEIGFYDGASELLHVEGVLASTRTGKVGGQSSMRDRLGERSWLLSFCHRPSIPRNANVCSGRPDVVSYSVERSSSARKRIARPNSVIMLKCSALVEQVIASRLLVRITRKKGRVYHLDECCYVLLFAISALPVVIG